MKQRSRHEARCRNCRGLFEEHNAADRVDVEARSGGAIVVELGATIYARDLRRRCRRHDATDGFFVAVIAQGETEDEQPQVTADWDVCDGCGQFAAGHDHERRALGRPACGDGRDGRFFFSEAWPLPKTEDELYDVRNFVAGGVIPPGSSVLEEIEAKATADLAELPDVNEETRRQFLGIDLVTDGPQMLSMCDDFIALALWHMDHFKDDMSLQHAQLAHAGVTYATYLRDSIRQQKCVPALSRIARADVAGATAIMMHVKRRPKIITLRNVN